MKRVRILIVDDDASVRYAINYLLSPIATITEAENGLMAQPIMLKQPFDLVLTDQRTPVMMGSDFIVWVRMQTFKQPNIIMVSANREYERLAMICGANAFVEKPFDINMFVELVQKMVL